MHLCEHSKAPRDPPSTNSSSTNHCNNDDAAGAITTSLLVASSVTIPIQKRVQSRQLRVHNHHCLCNHCDGTARSSDSIIGHANDGQSCVEICCSLTYFSAWCCANVKDLKNNVQSIIHHGSPEQMALTVSLDQNLRSIDTSGMMAERPVVGMGEGNGSMSCLLKWQEEVHQKLAF